MSLYCSSASSKVHISGSHWTRNSSTYVERWLWRARLGSHRAKIWWIAALSPGASLPLRGSCVVGPLRLGAVLCPAAPTFPFAGKFYTTRALPWAVARRIEGFVCRRVSSMETWRDARSTMRGEGLAGRELHTSYIMFRQRGAMG